MSTYKYNKSLDKKGIGRAMKSLKLFLFAFISIALAVALLGSVSAISDDKTEKLLYVDMNYNDNAITVNKLSWGKGFYSAPYISPEVNLEKAELKILDKKKNTLFSTEFYISNKRNIDIFNEETGEMSGGAVELDNIDFMVIVPYFNDMDSIEIHSNYNDIVLQHSDIKDIKQVKIKRVGESASESEDESDKIRDNEKSKDFILSLVEVLGSIYKYIFG